MKDNPLRKQLMANNKGVTLIELLIVLVISAIVIGGVYKVFIAQTRAYTVQDQVAEVQQDVRGAMEIMVRDIRMAGFQTNTFGNPTITNNPIVIVPNSNSSVTVNYEYIPSTGGPTANTVTYSLAGGSLIRTLNNVQTDLLDNVTNLNFGYGIDANGDGVIDGMVSGVIPNAAFVTAANVGTARVLAIRIILAANPAPADPDDRERNRGRRRGGARHPDRRAHQRPDAGDGQAHRGHWRGYYAAAALGVRVSGVQRRAHADQNR
jgi:type IV pilus assembly protein PilW